jgi:hypothetical protein
MCPSSSQMRPTVFHMCPLRRCMHPSASICVPLPAKCAPQSSICAPYAGVCAPQSAVCARNNLDHPTWQRCGSHRGQSKSKFTLSKVNKTLTLIGRTRTLSDVTDGRTNNLADEELVINIFAASWKLHNFYN